MNEAGTPRIQFRLLGSVEAVRDGDTVPLGGPRQRALLALLLLAPGRAVPAGRLVEELWHGRPPRGASGTLPTFVSKLRAALGVGVAISSGSNGYAIDALPEQIDVARFEELAAEGREALLRGASRRAEERLQAALALWRGRPFGELSDGGALQREADRLEDVRLLFTVTVTGIGADAGEDGGHAQPECVLRNGASEIGRAENELEITDNANVQNTASTTLAFTAFTVMPAGGGQVSVWCHSPGTFRGYLKGRVGVLALHIGTED